MTEKKPEIEKLDAFLKAAVGICRFFGIICFTCSIIRLIFAVWIPVWVPGWWWFLVPGILLSIVVFVLSGIKFVQSPEIWIIERFGEYQKKLKPGRRWIFPVIDTVRAKPRLWERPVPIFATQPKIDFRDGSATLKDPKIYVELDEDTIEDAIYKVRNWAKWIEDAAEPIIRGYLNALSIREALDEGRARGNLIERLREAPKVTRQQLKKVKKDIQVVKEALEKASKDKARWLRIYQKQLEKEEEGLIARLKDQKRLKKEFEGLEEEAKERGFRKIHRIVVAEYGLSEAVIKARERVLVERRRAEAAVFEATREATLRTESIKRTQEEFKKIGFTKEDALRKAYELDVIETLANTKSLFLTGGDIGSVIASLSGIFTEVSERRKRKTTKGDATKKARQEIDKIEKLI